MRPGDTDSWRFVRLYIYVKFPGEKEVVISHRSIYRRIHGKAELQNIEMLLPKCFA